MRRFVFAAGLATSMFVVSACDGGYGTPYPVSNRPKAYPVSNRPKARLRRPTPAMMLIAAALAPSVPRNGPLMLAPPSYVISPNRLTMPIVNTKVNAGEEDRAGSGFFTHRLFRGELREIVDAK